MKVKVIKPFQDKYTKEYYEITKILEITEDRYKEILMVDKLVEEIKEPTIIENVEEAISKINESAREEVKSINKTKRKK